MTKIIAHAQVWNCAQFIAAAIIPIHKYVDEIWVFDGAYRDLETQVTVPYSTDGTEQVVKGLRLDCKLVWVPCKTFWKDEITKREFMLSQLNEGDWWYELIDDEILTLDVEKAFSKIRNTKARHGAIPRIEYPRAKELYEDIPTGIVDTYEYVLENQLRALRTYRREALLAERFFKYQDGVHYDTGINDIKDADNVSYTLWPRIVLYDVFMWHLKWLREKQRLKAALNYQTLDPKLAD